MGMAKMMGPDESNEFGVGVAKKLGVDEAILMTVISSERMARFANSSVTVAKNVKESGQVVYLAKGGRRIIGSSSNPERASLKGFIELLYKSMMSLPKDPGFVPLPPQGRAYRPSPATTRSWRRRRGCWPTTSKTPSAPRSRPARGGRRAA